MSRVLAYPPRRSDLPPNQVQHLVLEDVSWGLYERMLKEIGDRPLRLTFDNGSMEIMSPLPEHEDVKEFLGLVVQMLAMLLNRPIKSLGSTTFRRQDKQQGLEPDKCFYFKDEGKVRGLKQWDARKDPPPELVVEVDIFSSSIDREPIYASLGVPEIWRYDGRKLQCLHLAGQRYSVRKFSKAFPFLEVSLLQRFVSQLPDKDEGSILREFMAWVRKSGWAKPGEAD